jgi:hypothetical protein
MVEHRPEPRPGQDETEPRPLVGVHPSYGTAAGATVTVRIAVTNASQHPRVLAVSALGVDSAWVDEQPHTPVLEPGGSAVVEIRLSPPVGTLPARYPLIVAAQALDPETGRPTSPAGTGETRLVVNPRTQLALELQPRELRLIASRRFTVALTNNGAATAKVVLKVQAGTQIRLQLAGADREIEVGPGETRKLRGRVRVRKPQTVGARISHSFTITARGTESVRHVDGVVVQRSAVGPTGVKAIALLLVLAVWLGAAVIFIPALAREIRSSSEESAAAAGPGGEEAGEEGSEEPGAEEGEEGEEGAGEEGAGEEGAGAGGEEAAAEEGLQLAGTVAGDAPGGVSVRLRPIELVDEEAQGGVGVGVPDAQLTGAGMRMSTSFVRAAPRDPVAPRTVLTADDGSWAFAKVKAPGYYLLTFSKPGFQSQRYVVDSSSEAAAEPLEVPIAPGEGSLSGRITGPGGADVGGATITISDGTNTLTTSSNSEGDIGAWSINGLSTPSTYVITATKHGMSSEARVVPLEAGATGAADLKLVPGVATLTGKVSAAATDKGLAGITVSVSDGTGSVRTATTLTQPRGQYAVPTLPTPGTYTITFSGDGFQSRTRTLELAAGASPDPLSVQLRASTGEVTGITARRTTTGTGRKVSVGLENAGLTLANAEHTYKTTSTSVPKDGTFGFTGVAPGTYVLTTRYFGLQTDHATVEVLPGETATVDPQLAEENGAGVPAEASITGSVVDATTGLSLPACPDPAVAKCIHAEVDDAGVRKSGGASAATTYPIDIAPDTGYELPDPDATYADGVVPGLRPGLHTVRVTAPGYEAGSVDVEVAAGQAVEAPLVELFPAPRVEGTITTTPDAAQHPVSCVWIRTQRTAGDPLPACDPTSTTDVCVPTPSTWNATTADPATTAWCAVSDAAGNYSVQVSEPGTYALSIVPSDVEYAPQTMEMIELDHGETEDRPVRLDRYGMLKLRVLAPGLDDRLAPVEGLQVTVEPAPQVARIDATDEQGYTVIRGLLDTTTYTVEGFAQAVVDPAETGTSRTTLTNSIPVRVPLNNDEDDDPETLRLVKPLSSFVGQVHGQYDAGTVTVAGASVVVKAVESFSEAGSPNYGAALSATTDSVGCFGIDSSSPPQRGTACARPGAGATSTDWTAGSLARRQMVTNVANTVEIVAPGYDPLTVPQRPLSAVRANEFTLVPSPVTFSAFVTANPTSPAPAWSSAAVAVAPRSPLVSSVSATLAAATGNPARGNLAWTWTRAGSSTPITGTALPGTYDVTVTLDGYQDATGVLVCATNGSCAFQAPLVLHKLGEIELRVVDDATGAAIAKPVVTKLYAGTSVEQDASAAGVLTYSRLAAGTDLPYRFAIRAPGYAFGTTNTSPGAGDDVVLDCDGSTPGTVTVVAGETTICRVRLTHRLGTLSGTLKGILGPQGTTGPDFEHLTGVRVTATRCVDDACATLTTERRTAVTTLANTGTGNPGGTFSFRGEGTDVQGLVAGSYLLTAEPPAGFVVPTGALGGTVVELGDREQKTDAHAYLYARQVTFAVKVVDQHGAVVDDADSVRMTRDATELPAAGDPTATRQGAGAATRYVFSNVLPGTWSIWATGPGIPGASVRTSIKSSATGSGAEQLLEISRSDATVGGTVETLVDSTATPLAGARVTLTCAAGTTTPARFCPGTGPALGTDRSPLTVLTAADGTWSFSTVPAGTFVATFAKQGYAGGSATFLVEEDEDEVVTVDPLVGISRPVKVVLDPSQTVDTGLAATRLTLVPLGGTPGSPIVLTSMPRVGADGTHVATFNNVRWGCYRLDVDLPSDHHGTPVGPTGVPAGDGLGCPAAADVRVPDDGTTPVTLGYTLDEAGVRYDLTTTTWPGHTPPTTTITLDGPGTEHDLAFTPTAAQGTLYVPPGSWTVTPSVPAADAAYWQATGAGPLALTGTTTKDAPISLKEQFFLVTVTVGGLVGEEADLRVTSAATPPSTPPSPATKETENGTAEFLLPRGKWLIEGSWSTGPDQAVVDVVPCGLAVVLGPTPSTTPVSCP